MSAQPVNRLMNHAGAIGLLCELSVHIRQSLEKQDQLDSIERCVEDFCKITGGSLRRTLDRIEYTPSSIPIDLPAPLPARTRRRNPDTSHEAAAYLNADGSIRLTRAQRRIYDTLCKRSDGMTTKEISKASGVSLQTVSGRMRVMERSGLLYATDERRADEPDKPKSIVWKAITQ